MRISILIASLRCGGAERVVATLANGWSERQHQVQILTLSGSNELSFYKLNENVLHIPLGLMRDSSGPISGTFNNLWRIKSIRKALVKSQADLLIAFMEGTTSLAILSSSGLGIPIIISEVAVPELQDSGRTWNGLRRVLYPRAQALVVPSTGMCDFFRRRLQIEATVIPNPIPAPAIPSKRMVEKGLVLAVGRLSPEKGFDDLIRIWQLVVKVCPYAQLKIFGEGSQLLQLQELIQSLGLTQHVDLPGLSRDLTAEYCKAEMLVVTSHYEGFGNVIVEALSCGLPVVSFDCPSGPVELIQHRTNGLLIPSRDHSAFASAVVELLENPQKRDSLAINGPPILDFCGTTAVLKQWDALFDTVMAK